MKHQRFIFLRLLVLAGTTLITGCTASMQKSTSAWLAQSATDQIHVQSLDPQARLYVDGRFIGKGSGTAIVTRDRPATLRADKDGCATAFEDTGSEFNPKSIRDYTDGSPPLAILSDGLGVSRDVGKTDPLTYTVTPICPSASSPPV